MHYFHSFLKIVFLVNNNLVLFLAACNNLSVKGMLTDLA